VVPTWTTRISFGSNTGWDKCKWSNKATVYSSDTLIFFPNTTTTHREFVFLQLGKMYVPAFNFSSIKQWCYLSSFQKQYTSFFSFHKTMMSINILPKPSSKNAIYFSSKNNTFFSFHKQWCQLLSFQKKKWRELWVNVCAKENICILKESNTLIHVFIFLW